MRTLLLVTSALPSSTTSATFPSAFPPPQRHLIMMLFSYTVLKDNAMGLLRYVLAFVQFFRHGTI